MTLAACGRIVAYTTKKVTMTRASYAQLEVLVEFLEQNPGVAKGLLRTAQGKLETKRKWENLSTTLNSLGGAIKNGQGWAKYWTEKKHSLKKQCAQLSASMRRTGGGMADNLPELSALENRLVAVMGGQEFATGGPRLIINPFPQTTTPTEPPVIIEDSYIIPVETEMHSNQISPIPDTSHNEGIPASSTIPVPLTPQNTIPPRPNRRRRSSVQPLDASMDQFASIEARRVEAEMITAQAFAQLSETIINIANAISEIARKMPNP